MWNLEFKDQLCPRGRTNRVGKQEAAGAAGPGIKGFRWGPEGVGAGLQALRVGVIGTHPFSGGDVCPPLLAVPVQPGMEARDASWPGVAGTPPPGDVPPPHCPLAFQGDDSAPTLSFPPWAADPLPTPTPCGLFCPKRSAYLSRLSQTSQSLTLSWRGPVVPRSGLCRAERALWPPA